MNSNSQSCFYIFLSSSNFLVEAFSTFCWFYFKLTKISLFVYERKLYCSLDKEKVCVSPKFVFIQLSYQFWYSFLYSFFQLYQTYSLSMIEISNVIFIEIFLSEFWGDRVLLICNYFIWYLLRIILWFFYFDGNKV
jgi:hypothetical protein